jgi:AcrR family transcriptional regulator
MGIEALMSSVQPTRVNRRIAPSPRLERRHHARRLEIVRAAGRTFRVRGFSETGMRDIAAAADISPANLYNYFKGKQELLFFCQDNSLDRMLASLEKSRRLRTSAKEKLVSIIESHLRCVLDEVEGSAAHLFANGLPAHLHERIAGKRDRYERGIRNLIAAGIHSGEFAPCEPALVARAILGASNWSVRWFNPEGRLTAGEVAAEFARYLVRGLSMNAVAGLGPRVKKLKRTSAR